MPRQGILNGPHTGERLVRHEIFRSETYALFYTGPMLHEVSRICVAFPDLIFPEGFDGPGFAEGFFTKRDIPYISVRFRTAAWYQEPGFFDAMEACRAWAGPDIAFSTYGASMGGYGAILAADTLEADRCVALSPQFSIDPEIAPFERRYREEAARIGPFRYDISSQLCDTINYVILYDPTHRIDPRHVRMFLSLSQLHRVPLPGAAHGTLQTLIEMGLTDALSDLLVSDLKPAELRRQIRSRRTQSFRYKRRMANLISSRSPNRLGHIMSLLEQHGHKHFASRVRKRLSSSQSARIILHAGLPKTGTSAIQASLTAASESLGEEGVIYPVNGFAGGGFANQSWLFDGLRQGSLERLRAFLRSVPSDAQQVILSNESLFVEIPYLARHARRAFQDVLAPYEVRLILFERDLESWKRSFYLQSVRNRRRGRKTPEWSANHLWETPLTYDAFYATEPLPQLVDFDRMANDLAALSCAAEVHRQKMEPGQDSVVEFAAACGLPSIELPTPRSTNPSMTPADGEIQRQANAAGRPTGRLIKQLIARVDTPNAAIPPRKLAKFDQLDWGVFRYQPNPPLQYTEDEFAQRLAALRALLRPKVSA